MDRKILFVSIFLQIFIFANGKGSYIVVAPDTIQSNYEYSVAVTLPDNTEPSTTVKVAISGPSFNSTQTIDMSPYNTAVARFDVPKLSNGTYTLKVQGVKGPQFTNSTVLKCNIDENDSEDKKKVIEVNTEPSKNVTTKRFGPLNLKFKKEKYRVSKDVVIKVNSTEPIPHVIYALVVKGKILKHEYLEVSGNETVEYITITPTSDMSPKAYIYVYYIQNDTLISEDLTMTFIKKSECENMNNNETAIAKPSDDCDDGQETERKSPGEASGLVTMTNANCALDRDHIVI